MSADAPASGALPERGRGAPIRPAARRMGSAVDPDAVALASCVQELACLAYPTRPWSQLVAQLSEQERESLGGGSDRKLSGFLSAQFGAKAKRGPNLPTIQVVLEHCLPVVGPDEREPKRAEVLELFRAVHGPDATLTPQPQPRPRIGGLGVQLHQQRGENDLLAEKNRRLEQDNAALWSENNAAKARIQALEAQLAALSRSTTPTARPVGITPGTVSRLVRPYIPEQRPADPPGDQSDPDDSPPAPDVVDHPGSAAGADHSARTPPGSALASTHRAANTPRSFRPLPAFQHYPPDLTPPAAPTPVTPWIPRPRIVGRASVPAGTRVPAPRQGVAPAAVWGVLTNATVALPALATPSHDTDPDASARTAGRLAGAEIPQLLAGFQDAWADAWADLPIDQLPADRRGLAQMPLLLTAYVLSTIITAAPILMN